MALTDLATLADIVVGAPTVGIGGGNSAGASGELAGKDHDHAIRETSGPTDLTVGAIENGELVRRIGTSLVGHPHDIIWKWNETDATQFQAACTEGGTPVMARVLSAHGPVLRVSFPTKLSGGGIILASAITVSDPDLVIAKDANDCYRYVFHCRLVGASLTGAQWDASGPMFMCNRLTGANFYGFAFPPRVTSSNIRSAKIEAGASTVITAALPAAPQNRTNSVNGVCATFGITVTARHQAASNPAWRSELRYESANIATTPMPWPGGSEYVATALSGFGAGWASQTLDTVGYAFLGSTGTTGGDYFDLDQIYVSRHPMDR
jgi:hypothetical protein